MILAKEIRQFECYTDLSVAHQKDIDNFPMCFMFGRLSDEEIRDNISAMVEEYQTRALASLAEIDSFELKRLLFQATERILRN